MTNIAYSPRLFGPNDEAIIIDRKKFNTITMYFVITKKKLALKKFKKSMRLCRRILLDYFLKPFFQRSKVSIKKRFHPFNIRLPSSHVSFFQWI